MTFSDAARRSSVLASAALLSVSLLALPASAGPGAASPVASRDPRSASASAPEPLRLRSDHAAGRRADARARAEEVRSATVRVGRGPVLRTWRTGRFRQVGATWRGAEPVLTLRTRDAGGRWSAWERLEVMGDGPTNGAGEATPGLRATELWWVGDARELQLRVRGRGHRDLRLVVIDPGGGGASDGASAGASTAGRRTAVSPRGVRRRVATAATTVAATAAATAATTAATTTAAPRTLAVTVAQRDRVPRPRKLFGRPRWRADESWRTGSPRYNRRLKQVNVHHTVNTNRYSRRDVAPMIRGIYRYHTKTLGWSDIGYNFLVDRFGRAWVGRAGGLGRKVRGAHTLGFNENSTGIAVLGNFQHRRATRAARWKVAMLAAWKLDKEGMNPAARAPIYSHGSDRYRRGARPRLPRVAGHRDTNYTDCPGRYLYADLRGIRRAAQRRVNQFR